MTFWARDRRGAAVQIIVSRHTRHMSSKELPMRASRTATCPQRGSQEYMLHDPQSITASTQPLHTDQALPSPECMHSIALECVSGLCLG